MTGGFSEPAPPEALCRFTPLRRDPRNTSHSWQQQKVLLFFCRLRDHVGSKAERGWSTRREIQAPALHSQSPPSEVPASAAVRSFSFPHGRCKLYPFISEKRIQVLGTKCNVSSNKSCRGHMRNQLSERDKINREALSEAAYRSQ